MRDEHGEELDTADELVVAPEAGVEPCASVKDATVVLIFEPLKRHGWPLEVLEGWTRAGERPPSTTLARGDAATRRSACGDLPARENRSVSNF
jgi:hypothetical protein